MEQKNEDMKSETTAKNECGRSSKPTEEELNEMYAQPIKKKKRDVNKE